MSRSYSIYGLGVNTNVPIAGLAGLEPARQVDVRVSLGSMPPIVSSVPEEAWREYYASADLNEDGEHRIRVWRSAGNAHFRVTYADGTTFVVDALGSHIWATWPELASVEDTATYLLGPVLGFVLRLRGVTCLHASAVAIHGRAVALVGPSGSGKSTTAAAFARSGFAILTDDVLAFKDEGTRFNVQPAYPRVRLWPRSVEALFGSVDALPLITPGWNKRFLDLSGRHCGFQHEPLPLAAVYFLAERSAGPEVPRIVEIGARDGLMSLVANTYTSYLLDKQLRAAEFDLLGRLVQSTPLRRVTPSTDFGRITELCELITEDCLQLDPCTTI